MSAAKFRSYSGREEKLNAATHWLGIFFALTGGFFLPVHGHGLVIMANRFYLGTLLFMFGASVCYHSVSPEKFKPVCRKFDHCAIYLLITGTYAPLMAEILPDWRGAAVMLTLVILTAAGIAVKFGFAGRFHKLEVALYLLMGWLCVSVAGPLISGMPRESLLLLLAGGVVYTAGVGVYAVKKEFFHAFWHLFVLAGAILQFAAIVKMQVKIF